MNDLISRQAAIEAVFKDDRNTTIKQRLDALPSSHPDLSEYSDKLWRNAYERGKAEAQAKIIRCKDCKWKQGAECVRFAEIRVFPNDFCSRGVRRADGVDS